MILTKQCYSIVICNEILTGIPYNDEVSHNYRENPNKKIAALRLPKLAIFTNPKSPKIWHVQHLRHIKSPRKLRNIQFMRRERISHDM